MITAIIITKNEELMIEDCLKSISFVGEILLVDTGNSDKTNEIAKKYKARIVKDDGKSFSDWRNAGLGNATCEWILYIDADERLTKELEKEIKLIVTKNIPGVFAIPRRNFVMNKELKHGGWYPDYQKRLFHKTMIKGWKGELHEEPQVVEKFSHLVSPMLHIKHETFSQMVEKTNQWSEVEAKLMFDAKHPPMNIPRFLTAIFREFWSRMVIKKAFLDGQVGISFAVYQVFSRFVSYAKLWELQIKKDNS